LINFVLCAFYHKEKIHKDGGCSSELKHWPCIYRVLGILPRTAKKEGKEGRRKEKASKHSGTFKLGVVVHACNPSF
jgi:hypothetical protein